MFSDAERAALRIVLAAGSVPNAVTDDNMEDLERHFDENQIVELLGVVCLFGWLNRWNDTMATPIEERPLVYGQRHLEKSGWDPAKPIG